MGIGDPIALLILDIVAEITKIGAAVFVLAVVAGGLAIITSFGGRNFQQTLRGMFWSLCLGAAFCFSGNKIAENIKGRFDSSTPATTSMSTSPVSADWIVVVRRAA